MKKNRNYKKVGKTFWRVLECREIVALRDFLYKVWFVQFGFWKLVFKENKNLEISFSISWKLLFWQTFMPKVKNRSS